MLLVCHAYRNKTSLYALPMKRDTIMSRTNATAVTKN